MEWPPDSEPWVMNRVARIILSRLGQENVDGLITFDDDLVMIHGARSTTVFDGGQLVDLEVVQKLPREQAKTMGAIDVYRTILLVHGVQEQRVQHYYEPAGPVILDWLLRKIPLELLAEEA